MQFDVTILGSNGAVAAYNRYPSAQVVHHSTHQLLLDCGEGTQFRMNAFGVKRSKLNHIFISHLHGDHYYGLVGLLTTFNLHWREEDLHIYGPAPLQEIIAIHFKHSKTELKFKVHYHNTQAEKKEVIFDDDVLSVTTFPLIHRLPTTGFLIKEKPHLRKIRSEKIEQYQIPHTEIKDIKSGKDFVLPDGIKIPNEELTIAPSAPRSYAYCSDTAYSEAVADDVKGVDMLYHEATFTHAHTKRAEETYHSTSVQAAKIALKANVNKLLVGHFSARYENLDLILNECREIFPNTHLAIEGKTFSI